MKILMVAAENDALPPVEIAGEKFGAKVGGIGDVLRDVPYELAQQNCEVAVVIPSYGYLHHGRGVEPVTSVEYKFGLDNDTAIIYSAPGRKSQPGLTHYVVDHPAFISKDKDGRFEIYHPDPEGRPFETDAKKYARFCTAVAQAIKQGIFAHLDCIHLHDWHAALLLILRAYHEAYRNLKDIRCVYTIHNLGLQGLRPLSNLAEWWPGLAYDRAKVVDARWDVENPMKVGIGLSDAVHAVSPSYAEEILEPCEHYRFCGGEGLEAVLKDAKQDGRLFGILNGCDYSTERVTPKLDFKQLIALLRSRVLNWADAVHNVSAWHSIAHVRLADFASREGVPGVILTSVSRLAWQKTHLLTNAGHHYPSGIEGILQILGDQGIYLLLGAGAEKDARFLTRIASAYDNFILLNGYSDDCAQALYANGDLFLMPSSYEPCGISQMLAMRDGQPCVVHDVGGLKDTVRDGVTGFSFGGRSVEEQVDNFVYATLAAINLRRSNRANWKQICQSASQQRFLWQDTARQYLEKLYTPKVSENVLATAAIRS